MRTRRSLLLLVAGGLGLAGLAGPSMVVPPADAALEPAASVVAPAAAGEPRPGQWQDYVLSPESRTVTPRSVLSADPRQGSFRGKPDAVLRADGRGVRLTSTGDRTKSPLLTIDFGTELSGKAALKVLSASSPRPQLHACFSESKRYLAKTPDQNDGQAKHAPGCDTANIWNGFPGVAYTADTDSHTLPLGSTALPATIRDPQPRGFRYLTVFLDGPGWVELDAVEVAFTAAPHQADLRDYPGHFLSSDDRLNKIWYAGAYTVQLNTDAVNTAKSWPYEPGEADHMDDVVPHADPAKDVIYDGVKRDRIVWQGDLAIQGPVAYLSTGDIPAVENSLTSLAAQQLPDGYVPAASLVGQHNQNELRNYGEYVTWFVANMATHHLYTGDRAYLERWYPAITKAMAWMESVRAQDSGGLIGFGRVGSCGHYGYGDCGHETYINALYVRNLRQVADLARTLGKTAEADMYTARSGEVVAAINDQLWDETVGAYRLSREIPTAYPQDANATAALTGVADADRSRRALAYLRSASWGRLGALTVSPSTPNPSLTPFYAPLPSTFEVDARLTAADPTQVQQQSGFDLMKQFWGWMLDQDPGSTFWEHVQPDGSPNLKQFSSLAHGWGAGPTVTLTTKVLGVEPTSAGFAGYDVRPHPGSLTWAEGTVPTPHGDIDVSWQQQRDGFSMDVEAPAGTTGRLAVPTFGGKIEVSLDGRPVWDGSTGTGARLEGGYVVLDGVAAGSHEVRSRRLDAPATTVALDVSPATQTTTPDSTRHLSVTVSGRAADRLAGDLTVTAPAGWYASPGTTKVDLDSAGRPVSKTFDVYLYVPPSATSGSHPVRVDFSGSGVTARADATVTLSQSVTLFDFEDDVQGWAPGENVTSVAKVGSFANGPGRPFSGTGALEAVVKLSPASALKTVAVAPATPIDLTAAKALVVHLDAYGGAPGATGYEAVVTATGADGQTLTKTFPFSPDSWNALSLDVSGWASRTAVKRIEVGFKALGTDTAWQPRMQLDAVTWTS